MESIARRLALQPRFKARPGSKDEHAYEPGPLRLQDHYSPEVGQTLVRFRNIWYRPLD